MNIQPIIKFLFDEEPVYIIGGGPSLRGFDFNKLHPKRQIAIKRASEFVPSKQTYFSSDPHTSFKRYDQIKKFMEIGQAIIAVDKDFDTSKYPFVKFIEKRQTTRFSTDGRYISGFNSGYCALNYAFLIGANPIYLLGIDLELGGYWFEPNSRNWIDSRIVSGQVQTRPQYIKEIKDDFACAAMVLKEKGIQVYTNSQTLDMFEYIDLKDV